MKANRRSRFYEEYADEQLSRILTSLMVPNTTVDDKVSIEESVNDEASVAMSSDSEFEEEDSDTSLMKE